MIEGLVFICLVCRSDLERTQEDLLRCFTCATEYHRIDGIWRMLLASRAAAYKQFVLEYETIRRAEGRGSNAFEYYRALPFTDMSGRRISEWEIRGRSFSALIDKLIVPLERQVGRCLNILDLGAGNAWLSNRLAQRGHHLVALDLLTNEFDGLGAFVHYESHFIPVQTEFDHLPLADHQADLVIFNASFHYSTDYDITLAEALRVLSAKGRVVVLDTPVYRQATSGEQMVLERQLQFERQYGFPSNALTSNNYLTDGRVQELGVTHGLDWQLVIPNYGLRWALRPWFARLRRQREPARFVILIGSRTG